MGMKEIKAKSGYHKVSQDAEEGDPFICIMVLLISVKTQTSLEQESSLKLLLPFFRKHVSGEESTGSFVARGSAPC